MVRTGKEGQASNVLLTFECGKCGKVFNIQTDSNCRDYRCIKCGAKSDNTYLINEIKKAEG